MQPKRLLGGESFKMFRGFRWRQPRLRPWHIIGIAVLFLFWTAFVSLSGGALFYLPSVDGWDFQLTGQLGDSFGVVSALMTTLAAAFTGQSLLNQRREANKAKARANREERAAAARRAEDTLFHLMTMRVSLIAELAVETDTKRHCGGDALSHMARQISIKASGKSLSKADKNYATLYQKWKDELGHYFRFTYHMIVFIDNHFHPDDRYGYARMLRAQWSNSEQILIALNCAYGEGKEEFVGYVNTYALLHNIDKADREKLRLDLLFDPPAFDYMPNWKGAATDDTKQSN